MFANGSTQVSSRIAELMKSYKSIDDKFVYKTVESRKKLKDFQDDIADFKLSGISVIYLTEGKVLTFFAPGVDPYSARIQIENYFKKQEKLAKAAQKVETAQVASKNSSKKSTK